MDERTREEHLAWCKKRALEYLDAGDLKSAAASMASDLSKHPATMVHPAVALLGVYAAASGETSEVRRWIEGFN
jgi:hypothetical protein